MSKSLKILLILFLLTGNTGIFLCKGQHDVFTDTRDGKVYKTIKIGNQVWMAENLAYAPSITYLFLKENDTISGIYCYEDDSAYISVFGMLYSWEAAMHSCPAGWHLPEKSEFDTLIKNAGNDPKNAYNALKTEGTTGFEGNLGGLLFSGSYYFSTGLMGSFWSSTLKNKSNKCYHFIMNDKLKKSYFLLSPVNPKKPFAFSVRCVKDDG